MKNSGIEHDVGEERLLFKPETSCTNCQTFESVDSLSDHKNKDDEQFVLLIDLKEKQYYEEKDLDDIMEMIKTDKNHKVIISGSITYQKCRQLLDFITGTDCEYNGILIWELNML